MSSYRRYSPRTGYRRRFGYRRSFYNRFWRRNWRRSSVLTRQRNSTRSFTVCIPVEDVYTLSIAGNAHYSNVLRCSPCQMPDGTAATADGLRSQAQSLLASALFKTYVGLYDQMKINWVRHTVGVGLQLGGAGATAVKIYTSWDRRFTSNEAQIPFDEMVNGPESTCQMFVENSRPQLTRFCGARDLIERTQFFDAKTTTTTNSYQAVHAWRSAGSNVNFFNPAFFVGVMTADTVATTRNIPISMSSIYSVTFRNPRYGLSTASKGFDMKVGDDVKGEVGMDDETEIVVDGKDDGGVDDDEKEVRTDLSDEEIAAILAKLKDKT